MGRQGCFPCPQPRFHSTVLPKAAVHGCTPPSLPDGFYTGSCLRLRSLMLPDHPSKRVPLRHDPLSETFGKSPLPHSSSSKVSLTGSSDARPYVPALHQPVHDVLRHRNMPGQFLQGNEIQTSQKHKQSRPTKQVHLLRQAHISASGHELKSSCGMVSCPCLAECLFKIP